MFYALLLILVILIIFYYMGILECTCSIQGTTSSMKKDSFQSRIRTISGPNVFTRTYFTCDDRVKQAGMGFAQEIVDGSINAPPIDSKPEDPLWDSRGTIYIAPAFAATQTRDVKRMGCKKGLGWCCPCPLGYKDTQLRNVMNGN